MPFFYRDRGADSSALVPYLLDNPAVVEGAVVLARIKDVAFGQCCRFKGVHSRFPAQFRASVPGQCRRERVHRQWLDRIMESISSAQEFQDTLIYGPAYGKSERRVQTIFHVCKILMRKQFQNHGRHGWSPGLAV